MNIRSIFAATALTAVAVVGIGSAASAYTIDPATGAGFVGKGEVQTVLNLNNAGLQSLVDSQTGVNFTYEVTETYNVVEEFWTGPVKNRTEHEVTKKTTYNVVDVLASDARQVKGQKQYTGFNLLNKVEPGTVVGSVPKVGDVTVVDPQNPGTNSDHIVVEVTKTGSTSGLFVNGVLLPVVAPVITP